MSYLLAGFVTASAVTLAIRRRIALGQTFQVEAEAERGDSVGEVSMLRGWGTSTASGERGATTHHSPPVFFLWVKASASSQRGFGWCEATPLSLSWGSYPACCPPCHRGLGEATASRPHTWHHAPTAVAHMQPTDSPVHSLSLPTPPSKWDMSLAQYCAELQKKKAKCDQPPVPPSTPEREVAVGEFKRRKMAEDELPETVDFDWDVPPSDEAVSSPISRSPCVTPTRPVGRTNTPLGSPFEGHPAPLRLGGASRRVAKQHTPIRSPLRALPTRPPAPFRSTATANRGEGEATVSVARSWGSASTVCHRGMDTHCCNPLTFLWHKVSLSFERECSLQSASLELQWGKWCCGVVERVGGEASVQLPHTWHRTPHGHHSVDRQPTITTATLAYSAPRVPKVFEPVTPERISQALAEAPAFDDILPEALDWEEGEEEATAHPGDSQVGGPLSPLATRKTNRVRTPTTPIGTRMSPSPALEAIPREGRLTPIRIGSTNRVVLSPNGDGVPRTVPPPLPLTSPVRALAGAATNRTKSPKPAGSDTDTVVAARLPTALPAPLFRSTPLSPVRQEIRSPERKTNRIPTPTRTMA